MVHSHRILQDCLIKQHLHFIILFRLHFATDSIFVSLTRFHFDKGGHIPLHIVETPLQSECFANIRRFEHSIRLIQFVSGSRESIVYRFTDMLKVKFTVIEEPAFLFLVTQIGTGCQFDRIAPESFLHTRTVINFFFLCMNPFIQKKVGNVSQQQRACILNRLKAGKNIVCRMMPVVAETFGKGTDVKQVIRFENDK